MSKATGRAHQTRTTFRMSYAVATDIEAPPERIWSLLTAAADRAFKLKVEVFEVPRSEGEARMVWADGMAPVFRGERTFTLTQHGGPTRFEMEEVYSGLMLPLIAGSLPDMGPHFEAYARDLKKEAERDEHG